MNEKFNGDIVTDSILNESKSFDGLLEIRQYFPIKNYKLHYMILIHRSRDIFTHLVATMIGVSPLLLGLLISAFAGVFNSSCNVLSCIPCASCFIQAKCSIVSWSLSTAIRLASSDNRYATTGSCSGWGYISH